MDSFHRFSGGLLENLRKLFVSGKWKLGEEGCILYGASLCILSINLK